MLADRNMKNELNSIIGFYNILKSKVHKSLESNNYNSCMQYIDAAANLAYNYNWIFADMYLEDVIHILSSKILKKYNGILFDKYVFYDAFSMDNRGLSQQYIRALIDNNIEFLYITENINIEKTDIYRELISYQHSNLCIVPLGGSRIQKVEFIYNKILEYSPSKIFMHIKPWSIEALVAFAAMPNIVKYNINLTDHAFWLGTSVLNYNIEFRNYGCSLSVHKRGIKQHQLMLLPYYPIQNNMTFEGFPIQKKDGDVFLFSGANLYKIYGKNDLFLNTIKQIIREYPNTYFFYAGGGDSSHFISFIKNEKLEDRVFYLGFRKDINQVVSNIDVYIDTFPVSGGLMGEYAIVNNKPIVTYNDNSEDYVDNDTFASLFDVGALKSFNDIPSLLLYVGMLIKDKQFRIAEGVKNFSLVPSREKFGLDVKILIENGFSPNDLKINDFSFDDVLLKYLKIDNAKLVDLTMIKILGFKMLIISPTYFVRTCLFFLDIGIWKMLFKYLSRRLKFKCIK